MTDSSPASPQPSGRLRLNMRTLGMLLILIAIIAGAVIVTDTLSPRDRHPAASTQPK